MPNRRHRRPGPDSGFTLIELLTVILTMSVILMASVLVFKHSIQANVRLESNDNLKNYGQQALNGLRLRISQSRCIYQNDAYGNALWARLVIPPEHPVLSTTRLPVIRETGSLSPSQGASGGFDAASVGNALLFTEAEGHASAGSRWIDLYRPRAYYLSKTSAVNVARRGYAYDLTEWVGRKYADYSELVGADASVYAALISQGITEAWNSAGTTAGTTVYTLSPGGGLTAQLAPSLQAQAVKSATHVVGSSGDTHYAVAFNNAPDFGIQDTVPEYALASSAGDGFPNGFETAIVGSTGGRKILLRIVLVAEGYGGRYSQGLELVAAARNY